MRTVSTASRNQKKDSKRSAGKSPGKTVDEYLARLPEPARSTLTALRGTIRSAVPEDTVEIISYGIPAFRHKRVLVWYAGFANHCSFFPTASMIEKFKLELKGYVISKGTIHFPIDKPLSAALVKKMVKALVADSETGKQRSTSRTSRGFT
jgi:uncharacterized protein YdhG (YjbR/CyaY superfamily)